MPRYRTRMEKLAEEIQNENLPVDVLPYSNCEHFPDEPTVKERAIMQLADEMTEKIRRKFGMSRRKFVRTSAAFSIGMWAINKVSGGKAWAGALNPGIPHDPRWDACQLDNDDEDRINLEDPRTMLARLPGEFVFDVQSHHVTSEEKWRVLQPVHHAFICIFPFGIGSQGNKKGGFAGRTNVDPCENVGRFAYIKDIYLDSATTAGVLSPVPSAPDEQQPLPFDEANETAHIMENLAGNTMRTVTHGYVMPNRGWVRERANDEAAVFVPDPLGGPNYFNAPGTEMGTPESSSEPLFMNQELDWMEERAIKYRRYLRGWKVYTPYGDVPFTSGMAHDDVAGMAMNAKIRELNKNYDVPKVLASHKGVPLPTFDARRQACDDVPGAAAAYPDINFVIYHCGGPGSGSVALHEPYPADGLARSDGKTEESMDVRDMSHGLDGLIKALRYAPAGDLTARRTSAPTVDTSEAPASPLGPRPSDLAHWNSVNVSVDLGSQIRTGNRRGQAILYSKLVKWLGARRICYGTDSIWGGSPHAFIVFLRGLFTAAEAQGNPGPGESDFSDLAAEYNLPWGLDGDRFDPRVNALTGEVAGGGYASGYSAEYLSDHPSLTDPAIGGNWPTSMDPHPSVKRDFPDFVSGHPERSIRNGILGRNAADIYRHDADAIYDAVACDELQRLRDHYIGDKLAGLGEYHPFRTNEIYGPRTRRELVRTLNEDWKKNGWRA